jgi:hypothetical protein
MSVGSAFDAFVKSYLHYCLFGNYGKNGAYEKKVLFCAQVEEHNREWAWEAGAYAFQCYKDCGAVADLMLELGTAVNKPRFEFDLLGEIETAIGGVPVMGKPDIYFINSEGARVILDWKVNGFCSKSTTSPMKGYIMIRDGWMPSVRRPSTGNRLPHKDCVPVVFKGLKINDVFGMEDLNEEWATQLSLYAWLLGEEVGSQDLIVGVDQIVGSPGEDWPFLRVANHRLRVGSQYQFTLRERLEKAWTAVSSGHVFDDLSRSLSDDRCAALEEQAAALGTNDELTDFINSMRKQ